ncbi:MAG: hypothetical protein QNL04_13965, partial [SAR324 cluster bacterium]|nr:hypothetical protein [SAR324 cluster bacterium]
GFFGLTSFIFIIHFFFPIDWIVSLLVLAIALPGAFLVVTSARQKGYLLPNYFLIFAIMGIFIFSVTAGWRFERDMGLYHFQAVRIINSYPSIPGLTNLHHRFGNISAFYNASALVSFYPIGIRGAIFNTPLALIFILFTSHQLILGIIAFKKQIYYIATYSLLSVVAVYSTWYHFGAVLDITVLLYGLMIGHYLLKLAVKNEKEDFFTLTLLVVSGATIKMSIAPFGVTAFLIMLIFQVFHEKSIKPFVPFGLLSGLLLIPFFLHHIHASGMLLFPLESSNLNLQWSNTAAAINNRVSVTGWARHPGPGFFETLGNWNWIPSWWGANKKIILGVLCGFLATLSVYFVSLFFLAKKTTQEKLSSFAMLSMVIFPVLCGLIFWFLVTPSFRFSGAMFLLPSIFALSLATKEIEFKIRKIVFLIAFILFVPLFVLKNIKLYEKQMKNPRSPKIPIVNMQEKTTDSGVKVYVPVQRLAWDSNKFPNTPFFNRRLRFIGNDIQGGFMIQKPPKKQ